MAQYRHEVKPNISRSKGGSIVRAAAYNERAKLHDERTEQTFDYSGKQDQALWTGIFTPKNAPEWAHDLEKLSNEIERAEKRKDAQLARPIELSLAHEMTLEQNKWMMQDYIKENFTRNGYVTIAAIHEPSKDGDQRNIHAHLLVSLRTIDENGFSKSKAQEQENFRAQGAYTQALRESWEKHLKHHLERHGHVEAAAQISCKSLKEQGIDREPQQHLGPAATYAERQNRKTERGDRNRARQERNHGIEQLNKEHAKLEKEIAALEREERKTREQERETRERQERERKAQQGQESQRQAEAERRAQEMQKRNAASAAAIRSAWTSAPRDGIAFMIGLNERGLYVAHDERGNYFAVEKSGFAHRLPDKDMQQAIDALRRENSGLVIPTLEEQRAEYQQQRDQLEEERERERQREAMHTGATLYNRASMPSMQRDALFHIQDAREHREAVQRLREREQKKQERASARTKEQPRDLAAQKRTGDITPERTDDREKQEAQEQQQRQQQEREREEKKDTQRDPREQAREDKEARTEQTDAQRHRAMLRAKTDKFLTEQKERERENPNERAHDRGRERGR